MASVHKPSNLFPPGYQFAVPVLVLFPLGLPSDLGPYGLTFHDLRHAFASLLLAFGFMIPYVSQQLGHSSAKITLDTYGHILEEGHRLDREATLQRFGNAFHGATRVLLRQEVPGAETAKTLINLEPAIGLEPMTCALRVRRTASHSRYLSLPSQKPHHSWDLHKQQ